LNGFELRVRSPLATRQILPGGSSSMSLCIAFCDNQTGQAKRMLAYGVLIPSSTVVT